MVTFKSSQYLSLILLALLVSQAFVVPVLGRAHAEKLAETSQDVGSQKTINIEDYYGSYPGGSYRESLPGRDGPGSPGRPGPSVGPGRPGPGRGSGRGPP